MRNPNAAMCAYFSITSVRRGPTNGSARAGEEPGARSQRRRDPAHIRAALRVGGTAERAYATPLAVPRVAAQRRAVQSDALGAAHDHARGVAQQLRRHLRHLDEFLDAL